MLLVFCVASLIVISEIWWWTHRNRYWLVESKTEGTIKPRIVQLPLRHINDKKLRREIKIFNRLCLVMPTVQGVAVCYREQMRKLLRNPRCRVGTNPYERLLYGYACYVLMQRLNDEVIKRQLHRNLLFLLAPKHKLVKRRSVVWSQRKYQLSTMPIYKIFADCYLDPWQTGIVASTPWQINLQGSYIKYTNSDITMKRYAHAYTLEAKTVQTVTLKVATDKTDFDCQVNRGVVTCKHLPSGEIHTYTIRGEQVRLATSLCGKSDALEIYITWQGEMKIGLDGGQPLGLRQAEIENNQRLEKLVTTAYQSKFITGERLRTRYLMTSKLVPTLDGLTQVVAIRSMEEFSTAWSKLDDYRQIARLFHGFSLVFLYSGATPQLADTILSTLTKTVIADCHRDQLWLYLLDRTVIDADVLYCLNKMAQGGHYVAPAPTLPGLIVTRNWPYVKTLTVTNTTAQKMTRDLVLPLPFNQFSVVSANGTVLTVVGLISGRVSTYVLPTPIHLTGEWLTTHINLPLKIKLAGYETRQFQITRRESSHKLRLTKKDLAAAVSEINIHTDDKKLDALFDKTVVDGENDAVLSAVKAAYQNQDRNLLLVALANRNQITADVWQFILTEIVGLRVRAGKIYLVPCVNLMGEFTISLQFNDQKYQFNTRKNLSKTTDFVTMDYGNSNG